MHSRSQRPASPKIGGFRSATNAASIWASMGGDENVTRNGAVPGMVAVSILTHDVVDFLR
jgi:hypothetical protein